MHTTYSLIIVLALSNMYLHACVRGRGGGGGVITTHVSRIEEEEGGFLKSVGKEEEGGGGSLNLWQRMLDPMTETPKSTTKLGKSRSVSMDSDAVQL
jgi:hypothetical protein